MEKLNKILAHINDGGTVYIGTQIRMSKIDSKVVKSWEKSGYDLFKVGKSGSLYLARGKNYDCVDGCKFVYA